MSDNATIYHHEHLHSIDAADFFIAHTMKTTVQPIIVANFVMCPERFCYIKLSLGGALKQTLLLSELSAIIALLYLVLSDKHYSEYKKYNGWKHC